MTRNSTIVFNNKVLRNRTITEKNIALDSDFASTKLDDIAAHEFGHIISQKIGQKGVELSQKAYYNLSKEAIELEDVIRYLETEISSYSATYFGKEGTFFVKKYKEIISEVLAKNNSNPNEFTEMFVMLLREVLDNEKV